jgi:hypothetical protein
LPETAREGIGLAMTARTFGLILSATVSLGPLAARAETVARELRCYRATAAFAPVDSSEHRKYAPDREIDILHLALDITPDFKARTIGSHRASGQKRGATLSSHPIAIARSCQQYRLGPAECKQFLMVFDGFQRFPPVHA